MSDNHEEHTDQPSKDKQREGPDTENILEARIIHVLQKQAARVHFTPQMHNQFIQNLPSQRPVTRRRFLAPAFALAAVLLIVFSLTTHLLLNQQPAPLLQYTLKQVLSVPAELANGGQLLSLDPTGQHLVYQPANQPGIMYIADTNTPLTSNILAMRYAHAIGWSPDGTELVTTVSPAGTPEPLLALVHVGQYMKPLGPTAQAASWSSTSTQQIIYITQSHKQTQLWQTTSSGQSSQQIATLNISQPIQQIVWSHDGQKLALLTTDSQQARNAIYVMDAQTHTLNEIVRPGAFTIGTISWSTDKHYLTYEALNTQGRTSLHAVNIDQQKELFTLNIQKILTGYSWSPDSNAIVYSDGGTLHTYILHGIAVEFPKSSATQKYPFWLKDGRILYMNITNGEGKLAILAKV